MTKSKPGVTYTDEEHTWSGRGPVPRWMKAHIAAGRTKADFLVGRDESSDTKKMPVPSEIGEELTSFDASLDGEFAEPDAKIGDEFEAFVKEFSKQDQKTVPTPTPTPTPQLVADADGWFRKK